MTRNNDRPKLRVVREGVSGPDELSQSRFYGVVTRAETNALRSLESQLGPEVVDKDELQAPRTAADPQTSAQLYRFPVQSEVQVVEQDGVAPVISLTGAEKVDDMPPIDPPVYQGGQAA